MRVASAIAAAVPRAALLQQGIAQPRRCPLLSAALPLSAALGCSPLLLFCASLRACSPQPVPPCGCRASRAAKCPVLLLVDSGGAARAIWEYCTLGGLRGLSEELEAFTEVAEQLSR